MTAIYVEIVDARGSTPRDVGTAMKVTKQGISGTIGGGALEHGAISTARSFLDAGLEGDEMRAFALGPNLGQCCGGAVTLRFTHDALEVDQPQALPLRSFDEPGRPISLWLWGAGHVGRAVVTMAPAKAFDITWADTDADRFPVALPDHINVLPAADLPLLAKSAPGDAHHLIFTYSHDIDFALCAALLQRGTASIGLIGSYTKRARFFKRLRALGLDPSPITCPIGDKSLGKHPEQIAKGVLDVLLKPIAA